MKKNVFYFNVLLLTVLLITSCEKDDINDVRENYFEYAGKTHSIRGGIQLFYGHYFSANANNITLVFATDEHYIALELFVPNKDTKIVAGVYQPDNSYRQFTVSEGLVMTDKYDLLHSMKTVVVTVKVDGYVYTVDIEGTLDNNTKIKGNFTGQLEWSDESDDKNNNDYYGSMTITGGGSEQIIHIEPAQHFRTVTSTSNTFMVYFSGAFIVNFSTSNLTTTTIPAGTYSVSTAVPVPAGNANVSMNIPGVSGVVKTSNGSFNVQRSGSNYHITFSFTTDTNPVRTVTGYYNGPIPLYQ